ncbi:MAG: hypothetical protein ACXW3F_17715, partial [Pyrinomonadaceae bacterium]
VSRRPAIGSRRKGSKIDVNVYFANPIKGMNGLGTPDLDKCIADVVVELASPRRYAAQPYRAKHGSKS